MTVLHRGVAGLFALLLDPFAALPPLLGLTLISAVSGVFLLLGFRVASRPLAIRSARQKVQAHLLAVRLYRDDLVVAFRAQRALLGALAFYLGNMLLPFVVLLLPFGLLFAHLDARYGTRALHPGERTILKATLAAQTAQEWQLETPAGVAIDSVPVHVPSRHEIDWRLRAVAPGTHELALLRGSQRIGKEVRVAADSRGAAPVRAAPGVAALFTAPAEAPIDAASGIERVEVIYPSLNLSVFGRHVHWIIVFLVVSTAVALLLRKRFGVEF